MATNTLYYGDNLVDCPPLRHTSQTFKKAPKAKAKDGAASLFDEAR